MRKRVSLLNAKEMPIRAEFYYKSMSIDMFRGKRRRIKLFIGRQANCSKVYLKKSSIKRRKYNE